MADLTNWLLNTSSNDKAVRDQAEQNLRALEEGNWQAYVSGLAQELSDESKGEQTRQLASLLLKNLLDSKDNNTRTAKYAKWDALDVTLKTQIREALLITLTSKVPSAQHGAAMVIAKVSHVELLKGNWPDLLDKLPLLMEDSSEGVRAFALQCMGYVCEEHKYEADQFPQQVTNRILTSLVQGMASTQPNDVRLAATKALCDAVEFASMNFDKQVERDYLMQMICEATISPDQRVRLAAYICLVRVADIHYTKLEAYIQTIYQLTTQSFKDPIDDVAMQAIEFWSTVADVEIELHEQEDLDINDDDTMESKHYVEKACPTLLPLLLQLLTTQAEDQDEDANEWNPCMAAAVSLITISRAAGDVVVEIAVAYIKTNVSKNSTPEDWRWREAALTTFGTIVDGPSREKLLPFVLEAFHYLVTQGVKDPHPMIRRTTVWTLGRIFEFLHYPTAEPPLVTSANAESLVSALLGTLQDGASMAEKTCYAIQQLAAGFTNNVPRHELTPFFGKLVESLISVAYSDVAADSTYSLHASAFEAINDLMTSAATDSLAYVCEMVPILLARLAETISITEERMQQKKVELQSALCGALQTAIARLDGHPESKAYLMSACDSIMEGLVNVQMNRATVSEDVITTMFALCNAQGAAFGKYIDHVVVYLMAGLTSHSEHEVCRICVNAVGDLVRETKTQVLPHLDEIMKQLLTNVQSNELHRDVKPDILACFGDIATAIESAFDKYLSAVLDTLAAAMTISYNNQVSYQKTVDDHLIDYNNLLRVGIASCCAGVLAGTPDEITQIPPATAQLLHPFGKHVIMFVRLVFDDIDYTDEHVRKDCCALLGDVCRIPGIGAEFDTPETQGWVHNFLRHDNMPDLESQYASACISKLRQQSAQSSFQ